VEPEELQNLEEYLTSELHTVAAPQGFADRVLILAETVVPVATPASAPAKVIVMKRRPRLWVPTAVAAALLAAGVLTQQTHERREAEKARQAEQARQQFDSALRITGETLAETRQQMREAGVDIGN
jgi:hypothetical protein